MTADPGGEEPSPPGHLKAVEIWHEGYLPVRETGLYYLQSRYYNPTWGRFLNADAYTSTGQGLLGNNMFTYCLNNPINGYDPLGKWTMGFSLSANITLILGVSISIGVYWDDEGNVDLQWSYSVPGVDDTVNVGLLDAGAGISFQCTEADTVYDLYGPATYVGGSVGSGLYGGVDAISFEDASDHTSDFDGFQLTVGYGIGFDLHVAETYTKPILRQPSVSISTSSGGVGSVTGLRITRNQCFAVFMCAS